MKEIAKNICHILNQYKNCASIPTVLLTHHIFHDLNLDSLDTIQVLARLEKEYDIVFPDRYIDRIQYVYEIVYMFSFCIMYQRLEGIIECVLQHYSNDWARLLLLLRHEKSALESNENKMFQNTQDVQRRDMLRSYCDALVKFFQGMQKKELAGRAFVKNFLHKALSSVQRLDGSVIVLLGQ